MKLIKSPYVYGCCGKYIATTKDTQDAKIVCPSCGKTLIAAVQTPRILVAVK